MCNSIVGLFLDCVCPSGDGTMLRILQLYLHIWLFPPRMKLENVLVGLQMLNCEYLISFGVVVVCFLLFHSTHSSPGLFFGSDTHLCITFSRDWRYVLSMSPESHR